MRPSPQKHSGEDSAGQERLLLGQVERLARFRSGRCAVHIHLSRLQPYNRRGHHLRAAVNTFETQVERAEGQIFVLANGDLFFIYKCAANDLVEEAVMRVRYLFDKDPLAREPDGDEDRFCTGYDLERDFDALLAAVQTLQSDQPPRGRRPAATAGKPPERQPERAALDPQHLGELVESIARADLSSLIREQPVCAIVPTERPRAVLRELYISIAELRDVVMPGFDLASDRWLFQHLTRTLDRRMLKLLGDNGDRDLTQPFSLNLNVATLTSPEFLAFDASLRTGARGAVVIELQMVDVFGDLRTYAFARDFVKERGYRVCLDAIDEMSLAFIDRERLGFDLVKIGWQPEMIDRYRDDGGRMRGDIERLGRTRAILCRCDDDAAVDFGRAVGIHLFQGRHIDRLLSGGRLTDLVRAPRRQLAAAI